MAKAQVFLHCVKQEEFGDYIGFAQDSNGKMIPSAMWCSTSPSWAMSDLKRHKAIYDERFPEGYEFVECGEIKPIPVSFKCDMCGVTVEGVDHILYTWGYVEIDGKKVCEECSKEDRD